MGSVHLATSHYHSRIVPYFAANKKSFAAVLSEATGEPGIHPSNQPAGAEDDFPIHINPRVEMLDLMAAQALHQRDPVTAVRYLQMADSHVKPGDTRILDLMADTPVKPWWTRILHLTVMMLRSNPDT